jgi:DNA modification methylase
MDSQLPLKVLGEAHGKSWSAYNADCADLTSQFPENSIDLSIYSPPFANLYIYSDSACDMGNCKDDAEFLQQYAYLVKEIHRMTRPGRVSCVHCKNLVNYKGRDGMAGLRDFRGEIIRLHQDAGFAYHSEVVIWKDPVIEMQRTKAHGLLWKQIRADSTFSRMGMPEYILVFRKWADNEDEQAEVRQVTHSKDEFPVAQWQQWASPVWMDINQTNVLNKEAARDAKDEKHICPLQLDVIDRCVNLWSNPGEVVLSPFMGIGSEGYQSLKFRRKFIGMELSKKYFDQAVAFLTRAEAEQETLFDVNDLQDTAIPPLDPAPAHATLSE